jgi:hypothetical protein
VCSSDLFTFLKLIDYIHWNYFHWIELSNGWISQFENIFLADNP